MRNPPPALDTDRAQAPYPPWWHRPLTPRAQSTNVISIKGGCIEGLGWSRAIHLSTKSAMVPIPEGSEAHPGPSPGSRLGAS